MNKIEHKKRLFFSLVFRPEQQQQLLPYQQQALALCPQARAVDSRNLHLTLFFLGQTDEVLQQQLLSAAKTIVMPRFSIRLDTLAGFSGPKIAYLAPSVVPATLTLLQQQVAAICKAKGFEDLHDQYRPHVTLLRKCAATPILQRTSELSLDIEQFGLYCSDSSSGTVQYRLLQQFDLL